MTEPKGLNSTAGISPPLPAHERGRLAGWLRDDGPWWLCSFVFHVGLILFLAFAGGRVVEDVVGDAPSFEAAELPKPIDVPLEIERFEIGQAPEEPTELNVDTLALDLPGAVAQTEKYYDASPTFSDKPGGGVPDATGGPNLGGLGGFDLRGIGPGPAVRGKGGVGAGVGTGIHPGSGGDGFGFASRTGNRKAMLGSGGGTRQTERAAAGALNWLARHQSLDGSWSLTAYRARCKDAGCTGEAIVGGYESAATALALLPFLGAGETHESKGRYKKTIRAGISYLIASQKLNGDLRQGATMYAQGLATLALCECYGMTGDKQVGRAAQAALNFIMQAQDPIGGGWRYEPRQPGDTSVTGWQIMALKSGQLAYLAVDPAVLKKAETFLDSVSDSKNTGGRFTYMPGKMLVRDDGRIIDDGRAMTAVGLLCRQYLHTPRNAPAMIEGTVFLMENPPDAGERNLYYWYYATQVMHNQPGPDWDAWNRKMRRILIDTQCRDDTCAAGSWDPAKPQIDLWGPRGGRLMMTSLAALTLEVYYRYLPLYKLDAEIGRDRSAEKTAE